MTDEALPIEAPPTPQEPPASEQPTETAAAAPAAEAAATPDWQAVLEKVDPKELRKHPRIAGMVGSELQQERQRDAERRRAEAEAKAAQQEQENLRRMAREDPVGFSELWQSEDQRRAYQQQIDTARQEEKKRHAEMVGAAHAETWARISDEEREAVAKKIAAIPDEHAYAVFAREMAKIEAKQLSAMQVAEVEKKAYEAGRQAGKQEGAADNFKNSEAPGLTRPRGTPSGLNIRGMTNEEFDQRFPPGVPLADSIEKNFGR